MNNNGTKIQKFISDFNWKSKEADNILHDAANESKFSKLSRVAIAMMALGTIGPQAIPQAHAETPTVHHAQPAHHKHHGRYAHVERAKHNIAKIANPKAHELTADELNKTQLAKIYGAQPKVQQHDYNAEMQAAGAKSIQNTHDRWRDVENIEVASNGRIKNHINDQNHHRIDFEKYLPEKYKQYFQDVSVYQRKTAADLDGLIVTSKSQKAHNNIAIITSGKGTGVTEINFMGKEHNNAAFLKYRNEALRIAVGESLKDKTPLVIKGLDNQKGLVFADMRAATGIKNAMFPIVDSGDNVRNLKSSGIEIISPEELKAVQPRIEQGLEIHDAKNAGYYLDQGVTQQDVIDAQGWNKHMKDHNQEPEGIINNPNSDQPEFS